MYGLYSGEAYIMENTVFYFKKFNNVFVLILALRCECGAELSGRGEAAGKYSLPCQTRTVPGDWQI